MLPFVAEVLSLKWNPYKTLPTKSFEPRWFCTNDRVKSFYPLRLYPLYRWGRASSDAKKKLQAISCSLYSCAPTVRDDDILISTQFIRMPNITPSMRLVKELGKGRDRTFPLELQTHISFRNHELSKKESLRSLSDEDCITPCAVLHTEY